jgi:hypothetical protein
MLTVDELIPDRPGGYAKLDALGLDVGGKFLIDLDAILIEAVDFDEADVDGGRYPGDHPFRVRKSTIRSPDGSLEVDAMVLRKDIDLSALALVKAGTRWCPVTIINLYGHV